MIRLILIVFLVSSCSSLKSTLGPDGNEIHQVSCGQIIDCYQDASEVCEGGYKVVDSQMRVAEFMGKIINRTNLVFSCK